MAIKAITFDLWDTVLIDDSDEPKRKDQGLKPKNETRRQILWDVLNAHAPIDKATTDTAFQAQEIAYRERWLGEQVTPSVTDRMTSILADLGRQLPAAEFDQLVSACENMEVVISPDIFNGAADAIKDLSNRYKLGVISDTIYTPGTGMRAILERYGVRSCFSEFSFSDEVGRAKPDVAIFAYVAEKLGVDYHEMIHIGDRKLNDIRGAQALGMKAILFTQSRDESNIEGAEADAVATDYADLLAQIDAVSARN